MVDLQDALKPALDTWLIKHADDREFVDAVRAFLAVALDLSLPDDDDRWRRATEILARCKHPTAMQPLPSVQEREQRDYRVQVLEPLSRIVEDHLAERLQGRGTKRLEAIQEFQRVLEHRTPVALSWIRQAADSFSWPSLAVLNRDA